MKIDKKIKERLLLQKEVISLVDKTKHEAKALGLILLDRYFANHMGIGEFTIWNMRKARTVGTKFQLKKRLKVAEKLYNSVVHNKIII